MSYTNRLVLVTLLSLFLTACGSSDKKVSSGTDTSVIPPASDSNGNGIGSGGNIVSNANAFGTGLSADELRALGIEGDPLNYKTVYFQYNSSSIDRRSTIIAEAHGRHLQGRTGSNVTLEGHADERGTRDYNLALGERRAQTVSRIIKGAGASSLINTISYGEERPVNTAHNESAWGQNRRVEIKY